MVKYGWSGQVVNCLAKSVNYTREDPYSGAEEKKNIQISSVEPCIKLYIYNTQDQIEALTIGKTPTLVPERKLTNYK